MTKPMPLTFPSHAAAVWPLYRAAPRVLPAAALIVGSCTPDFAYLIDFNGRFTHSLKGTLLFCIPSGLLALAWLELIAPALGPALPRLFGVSLGAFLKGPFFPRTLAQTARAGLALWLGSLTHLLWDGFTHRTRWPASVLYRTSIVELPAGLGTLPLANLFQHISTVVGLGVMLLWFWRARPAVSTEAMTLKPRGRATLVILSALGAAGSVLISDRATANLWELFWATTRGAMLGTTAWCPIHPRIRHGLTTPGSPGERPG